MTEVRQEALLYEGKAKKIYKTNDAGLLWVTYKDDATAFDGQKKDVLAEKGELNNKISSIFFELLQREGVPNHFVQRLSATDQLVRNVTIVPIEVVVRNIAAGSLAKRLGLEEGKVLPYPVVEFYYKDDDLHDPFINEDHIRVMGMAEPDQVQEMKVTGLQVNEILQAHMRTLGIDLIDFKLEFGITKDGTLLLADEISPDTCRFWDQKTNEKLDKDRFRRDLGGVIEAYQEIYRRLQQAVNEGGNH